MGKALDNSICKFNNILGMLDYFYKVCVNKPNIIILFLKAKYKNLIKVLIRLNLIYT